MRDSVSSRSEKKRHRRRVDVAEGIGDPQVLAVVIGVLVRQGDHSREFALGEAGHAQELADGQVSGRRADAGRVGGRIVGDERRLVVQHPAAQAPRLLEHHGFARHLALGKDVPRHGGTDEVACLRFDVPHEAELAAGEAAAVFQGLGGERFDVRGVEAGAEGGEQLLRPAVAACRKRRRDERLNNGQAVQVFTER